MNPRIKLVLVGESGVGKTSFLYLSSSNSFSTEVLPVWEVKQIIVKWNSQSIEVELWEAGAGDKYKQIRSLAYTETDVFMICYSVADPESFEKVETYWMADIKKEYPDTPIVLVGLQIDKRNDKILIENLSNIGKKMITSEDGIQMAIKIGAYGYLEVSSLEKIGLKEVFDKVIESCLKTNQIPKKSKENNCILQ